MTSIPQAPQGATDESEALRQRIAELETIACLNEEVGRILGPSSSPVALKDLLDLLRSKLSLR